MEKNINLKEIEKKTWTSYFEDGLWDVFMGCYVLMFAIAPLLSERLGDFWSSFVFLPFWAFVYLGIWLIRKYIVRPRMGVVTFGQQRKKRLLKYNIIVFVVSLVSLILGIISFGNIELPGEIHIIRFSIIVLTVSCLSAYFLDLRRLYFYGVLFVLSFFVGEWLYTNLNIPHHGYPVAFGTTAGIIILVGLTKFIGFLRKYPSQEELSV